MYCHASLPELYTGTVVRMLKHFLAQMHPSAGVSNPVMASPHKDDFERCRELREWCLKHPGKRPHRRSDPRYRSERSLALWLERALVRRTRAINDRPSCKMLSATQTAHINSILTQPQVHQGTTNSSMSSRCTILMEPTPSPEYTQSQQPGIRKPIREKSNVSKLSSKPTAFKYSPHVTLPKGVSKRIRKPTTVLTIRSSERLNTGAINIHILCAQGHTLSSSP